MGDEDHLRMYQHIMHDIVTLTVLKIFLDPGWSSINRGVLICEECCGVHRSLGRHISQVKSLKKGQWSSSQLAVCIYLEIKYLQC